MSNLPIYLIYEGRFFLYFSCVNHISSRKFKTYSVLREIIEVIFIDRSELNSKHELVSSNIIFLFFSFLRLSIFVGYLMLQNGNIVWNTYEKEFVRLDIFSR